MTDAAALTEDRVGEISTQDTLKKVMELAGWRQYGVGVSYEGRDSWPINKDCRHIVLHGQVPSLPKRANEVQYEGPLTYVVDAFKGVEGITNLVGFTDDDSGNRVRNLEVHFYVDDLLANKVAHQALTNAENAKKDRELATRR